MTHAAHMLLARAARRVRRRVWLQAWLVSLSRSAPFLFCAVFVVLVLLRVSGVRQDTAAVVCATLAAWLCIASAAAWRSRRSLTQALALWDEVGQTHECFLSAFCFAGSAAPSAAEQLHIDHALRSLPAASARLRTQFPLRLSPATLSLPLAFVVLVGAGLLQAPLPAHELPVAAVASSRASEIA